MADSSEYFWINRRIHTPNFQMKQSHFHPFYEIYYLHQGNCRFFVRDTLYEMEGGSLLLINKGELHRTTYISSKIHERFAVNFSESYLTPLILEFGEEVVLTAFSHPYLLIPPQKRAYFEELLQKIVSEYESDDTFSDYMLIKNFQELLISIFRYQHALLLHDESTYIENTGNDVSIQKTVKYIRNNYAQNITLKDTAALAGMSPTYFSKKFRQITSFGFKEYLIKIRLAEASKLLIETDRSITDIALSCGFSDSNYFGDVFKSTKGISPLKYRKNNELI